MHDIWLDIQSYIKAFEQSSCSIPIVSQFIQLWLKTAQNPAGTASLCGEEAVLVEYLSKMQYGVR